MSESLASCLSDGLEEGEVIRRGCDGDVAHRGRQDWELGLDVEPSAIPTQQCVDGVGMAQIVDTGGARLRIADIGAQEESA
jgi:hypothetical protein